MKKWKISECSPRVQRQIAALDSPPVRHSEQEQGGQDALGKAPEDARITAPVLIELHNFRTSDGWDADNFLPKCILDGLVHAGVIVDDNIKYVRGVSSFGYRCKHKSQRCTEIEIYEAVES